jgi:hypothetical protein
LSNYQCAISNQIPLIPVVDKCGHFFDYIFIKHHITKTIQCPIRNQRLLSTDLQFDSRVFAVIQNRLKFLKTSDSPLVKNISYFTFNLKK